MEIYVVILAMAIVLFLYHLYSRLRRLDSRASDQPEADQPQGRQGETVVSPTGAGLTQRRPAASAAITSSAAATVEETVDESNNKAAAKASKKKEKKRQKRKAKRQDSFRLDTKKNTKVGRKILYFVLAVFAFVLAVLVVTLNISNTSHDLGEFVIPKDEEFVTPKDEEFVTPKDEEFITPKDGRALLQEFLMNYIPHLENAIAFIKGIQNQIEDQYDQGAVEDCLFLMDMAINVIRETVMELSSSTNKSIHNAHRWLTGVDTHHITCMDGLGVSGRTLLGSTIEDLLARLGTSLEMVAELKGAHKEILQPLNGKLPSWVTLRQRKMLGSFEMFIKADLVVSQDGTGDYQTVGEAVLAAPAGMSKRFVIHVKRGTYKENVIVTQNKTNLMIIGDGMNFTIITGSHNFVDGSTTFKSATLAAFAAGFILQDICIQNTAGPEKHQAVALLVAGDRSVINRCRIDAFQDTLYTYAHKQFYRDCYITGTVDFIFGNAAVVLQYCKLVARKPMERQQNMITAQGKKKRYDVTGISIQNCEIIPSEDLERVKSSFSTYLGRPWKAFATVVVMQSYIADHIDPAGWSVWEGDFAIKTCYFGEYANRGPGADTSKRVNWPGYHIIVHPNEAMEYTVANFIEGREWLVSTGVPYTEGLLD